jgi:hypothetical protein
MIASLWGFFTGRRLREMEPAPDPAIREGRVLAVVMEAFSSLYGRAALDQLRTADGCGVVLSNERDRINTIWRANYWLPEDARERIPQGW